MPRRLLAVNVLLGGVSLFCVAAIVQQLFFSPGPGPATRPRPAAAPAPAPAPAGAPGAPGAGAYASVASRNLFSPTRSEAPTAAGGGAALALAKPTLYGVVLRDGSPIAYLEDPATKRTAGYRIGDRIAGGTVQAINADQVVLASPAGQISVRLRDPSKPRAAAPPATPPGAVPRPQPTPTPPGSPQRPTPGLLIPPRAIPMPGLAPPQGPLFAPGVPPFPSSPSLGRRLPIPRAQDAPQR